jgi:hypothetical protein
VAHRLRKGGVAAPTVTSWPVIDAGFIHGAIVSTAAGRPPDLASPDTNHRVQRVTSPMLRR